MRSILRHTAAPIVCGTLTHAPVLHKKHGRLSAAQRHAELESKKPVLPASLAGILLSILIPPIPSRTLLRSQAACHAPKRTASRQRRQTIIRHSAIVQRTIAAQKPSKKMRCRAADQAFFRAVIKKAGFSPTQQRGPLLSCGFSTPPLAGNSL